MKLVDTKDLKDKLICANQQRLAHREIDNVILYGRIYKMKKLSSKKKILQIRMLNKNIQKMKIRKNKRVKDEKKAAERERVLPRNR